MYSYKFKYICGIKNIYLYISCINYIYLIGKHLNKLIFSKLYYNLKILLVYHIYISVFKYLYKILIIQVYNFSTIYCNLSIY